MNEIKKVLNKYNYKVNKIYIKNNLNMVSTNNGDYVIKKNINKNTRDLFNYLNINNFNNYLDYINNDQDNFMIYPYIKEINISKEEKAINIIEIISILHNNTVYKKNYSLEEIKEDYEKQINEIEEINNYYEDIRLYLEEQEFLSPSEFYLLKNISWIFHSLDSSKYFLDKWYEIIKEIKSKRIVLNHGNLELDHLIIGPNKYLINWDYSINDIPIFDLIIFYKNNFKDVDFNDLYELYNSYFKLYEEEQFLFFSKILIPEKMEFKDIEIKNMENIYYIIKYLQESSRIISNYHSSNTNNEKN